MAWAPDYVTLSELKSYVDISDANDDAELALAITAASRAIDVCTGRQFGKVATTEERFYTAEWDRHRCRWIAEVDDLQTTVGLVLDPTDYVLEPRNAVVKGLAWTRFVFESDPRGDAGDLAVTAPWGWTAYPSAVKFATKLQTDRFRKRRDAPFGVAGSPDLGSEMRLLSKVDPDVAVSLKRYVRDWWAA